MTLRVCVCMALQVWLQLSSTGLHKRYISSLICTFIVVFLSLHQPCNFMSLAVVCLMFKAQFSPWEDPRIGMQFPQYVHFLESTVQKRPKVLSFHQTKPDTNTVIP